MFLINIRMRLADWRDNMFETHEMFSLKGRTAIITGGLTGLGLAITRCMVGAGAKAVVLSREQQSLQEDDLGYDGGRL